MDGAVVGRVLGLDVGERWIGVALSDPLGILASPLMRIERTDDEAAVSAIAGLIERHDAKAVVVGLPYRLDGNVGQQAARVQGFVRKVSECVGIPVETWDERLSTVAVKREMIESGMRREKRREKVDSAAAALILQGYLDRLRLEQTREQETPASGEA